MKLQKYRVYVLLIGHQREPSLVKLVNESTLCFNADTLAICKDKYGNVLVVNISDLKVASEKQRVAFNRKYYERA